MKLRMDADLFTGPLRREIDRRIKRERDIEKAIRRGAATVLTTARRSILKSQGGGNIRPEGDTASLPGQPPRNNTGNLQQTSRVYPMPGGADVGFNANYAQALEYGTRRIRPRPFLRPAVEENQERIEEFVREELRRFYTL